MEVAEHSIHTRAKTVSRANLYKMWKQPLHKWDQYVYNRHKTSKQIDAWSSKCLYESQGKTAVYNSGGMFFKDFNKEIIVVEHVPCPVDVPGMIYLEKNFDIFERELDTLIMINPIAVKYHSNLWDFFARPGQSRAGYKGNILAWLSRNSKIFLSFSDWHMNYDRLKYCPQDFVNMQIADLESRGITCVYKEISSSDTDVVNGNVKLEFSLNETI